MPSSVVMTTYAPTSLSPEDLELPISRKRPSSSSNTSSVKKSKSTDGTLDEYLTSKKTSPRQIYAGKRRSDEEIKMQVPLFSKEKENKSIDDNTVQIAQKQKERDAKFKRIVEESRTRRALSNRFTPNLPPTMALREDLKAQNLQEAKNARENGREEPKKKKTSTKRNNYWRQFK